MAVASDEFFVRFRVLAGELRDDHPHCLRNDHQLPVSPAAAVPSISRFQSGHD